MNKRVLITTIALLALTAIVISQSFSFDIADGQCIAVYQTGDQDIGGHGGVQVDCPPGYVVTGGGFNDKSGINDDQDYSQPLGNGWFCREDSSSDNSECYAVCCNETFLSTSIVSKQENQEIMSFAYCENKTLLGGGWADRSGKGGDQKMSWPVENAWTCKDTASSDNSECYAVCGEANPGYELTCTTENITQSLATETVVNCPAGTYIVGGGFIDFSGINDDIDANKPYDNLWNCYDSSSNSNSQCWARCCAFNLICTDADSDNYFLEDACSGEKDCNDDNISINPGATEICDDGIDNNCNTLTDCADAFCSNHPSCVVPPIYQCEDNLDNDGDNFTDINDPGCHSDGNPSNSSSYVPNDNDESDTGITCSLNSDCGINSAVGGLFCGINASTYQNFINHTCYNPGTLGSYCSSNTTTVLNQTCIYGCANTTCNSAPTEKNETCKSSSKSSSKKFCGDGLCDDTLGENEINCAIDCKSFTSLNYDESNTNASSLGPVVLQGQVQKSTSFGLVAIIVIAVVLLGILLLLLILIRK